MSKIIKITGGKAKGGLHLYEDVNLTESGFAIERDIAYVELISGPYSRNDTGFYGSGLVGVYLARDVNTSSENFGKTGYAEFPINTNDEIFCHYDKSPALFRLSFDNVLYGDGMSMDQLYSGDIVKIVSGAHCRSVGDSESYFVIVKSAKNKSLHERTGFLKLSEEWLPPGQLKTRFAKVRAEYEPSQNQEYKENKKMSDTKTAIVATLKTDATDAAWRTAGSQLVKATRDPLSALLSRHLGPDDDALRGKIGAFLQTELGSSMLSAFLSVGLSTMPETEITKKLSRELRVRAMAGTSDVMADVFMQPLREVMSTALRDVVPAVPKTLPEQHGFSAEVVSETVAAQRDATNK